MDRYMGKWVDGYIQTFRQRRRPAAGPAEPPGSVGPGAPNPSGPMGPSFRAAGRRLARHVWIYVRISIYPYIYPYIHKSIYPYIYIHIYIYIYRRRNLFFPENTTSTGFGVNFEKTKSAQNSPRTEMTA